jgi:TRAP-type C4-dicarboxylate transport system substrate-binding protein
MAESQFLPDGHQRAVKAAAEEIEELRRSLKATVEAEYSEQLAAAGPWRRSLLKRKIARQVAARLEQEIGNVVPPATRST